jgi:uncharacterized phage protein gp47/JayE
MANYGVTETGFVKKDYAAIRTDINARLQHLFGDDIDLTPGSPIKNITDLFTVEFVRLWTQLEETYKSGFIETAYGQSLDEIGALLSVDRLNGTIATGEVTFKRTTPLTTTQTRVIPSGTIVSTSDAYPSLYVTTETGYYAQRITDETYEAQTSPFTIFSVENIIGGIESITGDDLNDYTSGATYNGREITTGIQVPAGVELTIDYYPISITLPVQSSDLGYDSNALTGAVNLLVSDITFIHSVENESAITGGYDEESDYFYRQRIQQTANAIGNATAESIEYTIRNVTGVTNVIVQDFYAVEDTEIFSSVASGSTSVTVYDTPIYTVTSVTGATDGTLTITGFDDFTGEITFSPALTTDQDVTVVYYCENYNTTYDTEVFSTVSSGATTVTVTDTPIDSIVSVTGATDGALTVDSYNETSGLITFSPALTTDQDVTVVYYYKNTSPLATGSQGKIKIYISGGVVGDADTEDTIVHTIETTRAAGVQSIGYGTDSSYAEGDNDSPYSWFYRIPEAEIDVTITLLWDEDSDLTDSEKDEVQDEIETDIAEFINELGLEDKLWKNKILQIAISGHDDIDNATLDIFTLDGDTAADQGHEEYLVGSTIQIPVANTIIVTR